MRRVTEVNAGRKTAGVDGQVVLTPEAKSDLADWVQHQTEPWTARPISAEYQQIAAEQAELESILASPSRLREMVGTERAANLARYDERRWARSVDDDWPGPPLGRAAGSGP